MDKKTKLLSTKVTEKSYLKFMRVISKLEKRENRNISIGEFVLSALKFYANHVMKNG